MSLAQCVGTYSIRVAHIRKSSVVCALILYVDSEIAAADWSVDTKGSCRGWGPRTRNTDLDALSDVISSV